MPRIGLFSAAVVVCASLQFAPASAAPICTTVLPALDEEVTCTYNAGGNTDITVPEGAAFMAIELQAAGGGGGGGQGATGASGGAGARVSATLNVSGISTVRALVGGGGSGGFGRDLSEGGTGGGFTAIYAGASTAPADVLAVAGGGGGGGASTLGVSTKTGGAGAANNTPAGGDGISPGFGAPGDGNGGTGSSGADGATWAAGGAGGTGNDTDSGKGGTGYGGGEEGNADGTQDGGGGAGGSYVRPALFIGSAVYAPPGGAGGIGVLNNNGANGANGSITITFSAAPITPSAGTSTSPSFVDFTYLLTDGRECTSISPQRVQVGTFVELPGEDALCKTTDGSLVAGWTIPVPPGFTGAGSSSLPFTPGHKVRVIESQRFTAVPFDLVITVEYDANIAADDACMPATMAFTTDNGRTGMAWVPRVDFAIARTWSAASCVPGGYELTGWNTAGEGSGESIGLGAPLPESWMLSRTNERRLYAMWRAE